MYAESDAEKEGSFPRYFSPNLNKQETQPTTDANSLKFSVYTEKCKCLRAPKRTKDPNYVAINFLFNAANTDIEVNTPAREYYSHSPSKV